MGDKSTSFWGLCTHGIWVQDPNFRVLSSSGQFIRNGTWVGPKLAIKLTSFWHLITFIDDALFSDFNYTWNKGLVKFGNGSNFLIKSVDKYKLITLSDANDAAKNLIEETWIKQ